jgi:WD40 repeat protein
MLISAGDDRKVKFWDTRKMDKPVLFLTGHSHWVRTARYNPYHDQLVLSGGCDAMVNLWRIASCSSAPWLGGGEGDSDPPNVKVKAIDQHEESIYGVAWSPADAWIYCSLSFDGR